MSEHEGFCIPLVEAMEREIPIIAYSSTAVPETMGQAGIVLDCKDEKKIAHCIVRLLCDDEYREKVISLQKKRVKELSVNNYKSDLKKIIEEVYRIENYLQPYESKGDLFHCIMSKPEISSKPYYLDVLKKLFKTKDSIVIYGIGKVGKELLTVFEIYETELLRKIVICDNSFGEKYYNNIPVIRHNECIKKYKEALYIITVQNACVDIIASLITSNIKKQNIKFYNFSTNKIV